MKESGSSRLSSECISAGQLLFQIEKACQLISSFEVIAKLTSRSLRLVAMSTKVLESEKKWLC